MANDTRDSRSDWGLRACLGLGLAAAALACCLPARASEPNAPPPGLSAPAADANSLLREPVVGAHMLVRTLLAMVLVSALCVAVLYGSRRLGGRWARMQGREIRVVETVPLGSRKSLHLVQVGDRRLLIGASADRIVLLGRVPGSQTIVEES